MWHTAWGWGAAAIDGALSSMTSLHTWEADEGPIEPEHLEWADAVLDRQGVASLIIDAGPFIVDSENLNSRLWALIKRAIERGEDLHTTHPVLARVWRDHPRQANLARAIRWFDIHPLDESVAVGRRLAASGTSDVVDAHLAVVAEGLGTFILTSDREDMSRLNARFEVYCRPGSPSRVVRSRVCRRGEPHQVHVRPRSFELVAAPG